MSALPKCPKCDSEHTYEDGALNITGITDQVTAANTQTLGYSAANRLNR